MNNSTTINKARGTRWCRTGTWMTATGLLLVIGGLAGGRAGILSPIASFTAFGIGCLIVAIGVIVTGIGLALSMGTAGNAPAATSWAALAVGIMLIGAALNLRPDAAGVPPIHDLTTDLTDPPLFDAILPLRADAPNPPGYAGTDTAEQQRAAYPELRTLTIGQPVAVVFAAAERIARETGWEIVAADAAAGRIEATDTTTWFRFKDDVVIRLRPNGTATDVDVRSKSRVGRSDMGTNARRIRTFLTRLSAETAA